MYFILGINIPYIINIHYNNSCYSNLHLIKRITLKYHTIRTDAISNKLYKKAKTIDLIH
jgi:hypothetical protein